MLIVIRYIEYIIYTISFIIAYLMVETLSGWFRAYVAKKMGDDTPEEQGFLSLNPLVHIDPIGMLMVVFIGFGWGRAAPINPHNIRKPWRNLKLFCAYFSDTFSHLVLALGALIVFFAIFGEKIVDLAGDILFYRDVSLRALSYAYPTLSSLSLSMAVVLVAVIYISIILAVLNFIINGFRLAMVLLYDETIGLWYLDLLVPILLILFLADHLRALVVEKIIAIAQIIVTYIGLI